MSADRHNRQGIDLSTPKQVYNALREISSIKLYFVDEREVQRATVDMKAGVGWSVKRLIMQK